MASTQNSKHAGRKWIPTRQRQLLRAFQHRCNPRAPTIVQWRQATAGHNDNPNGRDQEKRVQSTNVPSVQSLS